MKKFAILITVLVAGSGLAQQGPFNPALTAEKNARDENNSVLLPPEKPNEMRNGGVTYSGIAVEAAKARNPLQLINPLAPEEYGSGMDNVGRDPITRNAGGLKIISLEF